jgi:hypothetical protein
MPHMAHSGLLSLSGVFLDVQPRSVHGTKIRCRIRVPRRCSGTLRVVHVQSWHLRGINFVPWEISWSSQSLASPANPHLTTSPKARWREISPKYGQSAPIVQWTNAAVAEQGLELRRKEWVNEKMNAKNNNFKVQCIFKQLIYLGARDGGRNLHMLSTNFITLLYPQLLFV